MATPNDTFYSDLAKRLNDMVDCADLAQRLGLERPGGDKGNFKSPHHADKSPSLAVPGKYHGKRWIDYSVDKGSPGSGGQAVDLVMAVQGLDFVKAVVELAGMYGVPADKPKTPQARRELPMVEWIAENCLKAARADATALVDYLTGRGISRAAVERAVAKGTVGLNTWHSDRVAKGEVSWGGPGAAFILRDRVSTLPVAVEMRYINPADNGGVKSGCQGEKSGNTWCSDWRRLESARVVYVVESPINALSIETLDIPGVVAVATMGTGNVENVDWRFLRGKQVLACFDNDKPRDSGPDAGYAPGLKAAWRLHELLIGLDVSCLLVDQAGWLDADEEPINDVNDLLQAMGVADAKVELQKKEGWLIPGMVGDDSRQGRPRIFLPHQDYLAYWRYRVNEDFTRVIGKTIKSEEEGKDRYEYTDVCGFRVAAVSRVQIASPTSTMTGDADNSPATVFAISVQVPRHGPKLQRRVVDDEKLHNVDVWKKLGPVFAPGPFARMINVWERAAGIGARDAVNFVGLAWRDGRPVVNEGPDCFFSDPRQQCPYNALSFPSGTAADALEVVRQFQGTFKANAATIPLVWALGGHLKAYLGFWPHFVMQAEKGSGKSTLVKRIERAIAMTMFSGQSLETGFRLLTSISYTSHPVGWEEISARKQEIINRAVTALQECYQYTHTRRGAELIDFLLCAPVLLAGEDVPVKSLTGKVVRSQLTQARRGPLMPEDMPVFPVRQWLRFLAGYGKAKVKEIHAQHVADLGDNCMAKRDDAGAERMITNYAALATSWTLLCEFAGMAQHSGGFQADLTAEMNAHIGESASERQPWVWIVEKLLSEIAAGQFRYPYKFDEVDEVPVLCVRTSHVMDHMSGSNNLREFWDALPVKSDRVFKTAVKAAGVLADDDIERTVGGAGYGQGGGKRVAHMVAFSLPLLDQFGLHAVVPEEHRAVKKEDAHG